MSAISSDNDVTNRSSKTLKKLMSQLSKKKILSSHDSIDFFNHIDNKSLDPQQRIKALKLYIRIKIENLQALPEVKISPEISSLLSLLNEKRKAFSGFPKAQEVLVSLKKQIFHSFKESMSKSVEKRANSPQGITNIEGLTSEMVFERLPLRSFNQAGYAKFNSKKILSELLVYAYCKNPKQLIFKMSNIPGNLKLREELFRIYPKFVNYRIDSKAFHLAPYIFSCLFKLYILNPRTDHFKLLERSFYSSFLEIDNYLKWRQGQKEKVENFRKEVEEKIAQNRLETEARFKKKREDNPLRTKNSLPSGPSEYLPVGHDESHWWSGE
jgi:hypothetical protein